MDRPATIISAFTEDEVERLTGISRRQLRYWDRTNFFVPSLAHVDRSLPLSRLYSFRDLVSLKVLNALRNDAQVALGHLREVKSKLEHLGDRLWAATTLYVLNRKVVFDNPETQEREEIVSRQGVLQIPLKVVTGDMNKAVEQLRRRDDASVGRIKRDRAVAQNQPVISGTRITVRSIKAFYDAGFSVQQILTQYPTLTDADVEAAIRYEEAA